MLRKNGLSSTAVSLVQLSRNVHSDIYSSNTYPKITFSVFFIYIQVSREIFGILRMLVIISGYSFF